MRYQTIIGGKQTWLSSVLISSLSYPISTVNTTDAVVEDGECLLLAPGGRTLRAHKSATRGAGKRLQNGRSNGPTAPARWCQSKTVVPMIGPGT